MKTDTIAAIATALSESGIGIIRISGEEAISIVNKIFVAKKKDRIETVFSQYKQDNIKDILELCDGVLLGKASASIKEIKELIEEIK